MICFPYSSFFFDCKPEKCSSSFYLHLHVEKVWNVNNIYKTGHIGILWNYHFLWRIKVHGFCGLPSTIKYFIHNFEPELNLFLPLMFHCFKMFTQFSNKTGWKTLNAVLPKRQSSQILKYMTNASKGAYPSKAFIIKIIHNRQ